MQIFCYGHVGLFIYLFYKLMLVYNTKINTWKWRGAGS